MQRTFALAVVALLAGPLHEDAMAEDSAFEGPPTPNLSTPGVVTTHQMKPFEDLCLYAIYLGAGRRIHTVEAFLGQNVEDPAITLFKPVDWETAIAPRDARIFSVTAGVSADAVSQFWVGWIQDRTVYMDALTEEHVIKAVLADDEALVVPPVMDGAGAASLFSWRAGTKVASLWQRVFKGNGASAHSVVEIPGHPLISRAAAVPGHPQQGVVGWVERAEAGSVLGLALVERGRATIWRSEPIAATVPISEQRIGVWASNDGRLEVSALLTERDGAAVYRLAHLSARRGETKAVLKSEGVTMKEGQLGRAAIEYSSSLSQPVREVYLLTKDGRLLAGRHLKVVRRSVPPDSPLPIVEGFWVSTTPHGPPRFERLGGP
jgi:hypothetical protein